MKADLGSIEASWAEAESSCGGLLEVFKPAMSLAKDLGRSYMTSKEIWRVRSVV